MHAPQASAYCRTGRARQLVASVLILLAASSGPLAQQLRVVRVQVGGEKTPAQTRCHVVLASSREFQQLTQKADGKPAAPAPAPTEETRQPQTRSTQVIQPLAEQWDGVAGIAVPEAPPLPARVQLDDHIETVVAFEFAFVLPPAHAPPLASPRGPPAVL